VSQREAERIEAGRVHLYHFHSNCVLETAKRLQSEKKLSLVLDLDHTLVHATTEYMVSEIPQNTDIIEFTLPPNPTRYFVKLR
jgi:hypothetical protein